MQQLSLPYQLDMPYTMNYRFTINIRGDVRAYLKSLAEYFEKSRDLHGRWEKYPFLVDLQDKNLAETKRVLGNQGIDYSVTNFGYVNIATNMFYDPRTDTFKIRVFFQDNLEARKLTEFFERKAKGFGEYASHFSQVDYEVEEGVKPIKSPVGGSCDEEFRRVLRSKVPLFLDVRDEIGRRIQLYNQDPKHAVRTFNPGIDESELLWPSFTQFDKSPDGLAFGCFPITHIYDIHRSWGRILRPEELKFYDFDDAEIFYAPDSIEAIVSIYPLLYGSASADDVHLEIIRNDELLRACLTHEVIEHCIEFELSLEDGIHLTLFRYAVGADEESEQERVQELVKKKEEITHRMHRETQEAARSLGLYGELRKIYELYESRGLEHF